jgi:hypothetical protein
MESKKMKKQITADEFLMLVGLFTLAKYHMTQIQDIECAAIKILSDGDEDNTVSGTRAFVSDEIFGRESDARSLFERHKIVVMG